MGKYMEEASAYARNADSIIEKLEAIKTKYESALGKIVEPKDGDYLTEHVIAELELLIKEIDDLITDINGRKSKVSSDASEIDQRIEEERLARERALENGDNADE